jgi:hypothetical protein
MVRSANFRSFSEDGFDVAGKKLQSHIKRETKAEGGRNKEQQSVK